MLLSLFLFSSQKVKPDLVIPLPGEASDVVWSADGKSLYIGDDKGVTEWPSGRFVKAAGCEFKLNSSKTKLMYSCFEGNELSIIDLKTFRSQSIKKDYKRAWWWDDRIVLLRGLEHNNEFEKRFVEIGNIKIPLPQSPWFTCGDGPVLMAKKWGDLGGFYLYRINLKMRSVSEIVHQKYANQQELSGADSLNWDEKSKRGFITWTASNSGTLKRYSFLSIFNWPRSSFVEGYVHQSKGRIVFMEREYARVDNQEADTYRIRAQENRTDNLVVLASWTIKLYKDRMELPYFSNAHMSDDGRRLVWQEMVNRKSKLVVREIDARR